MNTTKILCKYLDPEKKGFVNGGDIICCGILIVIGIIFFTIVSAFAGEIVRVDILNNGEYTTSLFDVFTTSNIYLGFLTLIPSIWIILFARKTISIVCKLIMEFSRHKFIICKRDD